MKKSTFFGVLALAIAAFSACTEKWDLTNVNTEMELDMGLAIPLANITATVDSFLPQSGKDWVLDADADGTVYLNIQTESKEVYNDNLQHDGEYTSGSVSATIPAGTSDVVSIPIKQPLGNINRKASIKVSWGRFKSVVFSLSYTGLSDDDVDRVYLVAPNLSATADPNYVVQLSKKGTGLWESSNLQNQYFRMDRNLEFPMTLCIKLKNTIATDTQVTAKAVCKVHGYEVLYGEIDPDQKDGFEHKSILLDDYIDASLLDSLILPFKNPIINMTLASNVGAPLEYAVKNVKAVTKNGRTIVAEFPNSSNNFTFVTKNYPNPEDFRQVGDTTYNTQTFDKDFGHTDRLFAYGLGDRPKEFHYDYSINLPDTFLARNVDMFVTEYPFYHLDMDIKLPFDFNEGLFAVYSDTIDLNLDTLNTEEWRKEIEDLDSLIIYVSGTNGLPVDVKAHLDYMDAKGARITAFDKSLYDIHIPSAATDADGKVIKSQLKKFDPIVLKVSNQAQGDDQSHLINKISKIVLRAWLEKPTGMAHLEKTNTLQLHVALKGHGKYTVNKEEGKK